MALDSLLPLWPPRPDGVFWVGAALVLATATGESVYRLLGWPRLVGYAVAGMLIAAGGRGLDVYTLNASVRAVVDAALSVLLFEIGHRVNLRWLRANPALLGASLAESTLSLLAVFVALRFLGIGTMPALAVGGLLMATSPAATLRISTEFEAKGQVKERMLLFSALNTFYAILVCAVLLGLLNADGPIGPSASIVRMFYILCGSVLAAALLAYAVNWVEQHFDFSDEGAALLLVGLILLTLSVTRMLGWSTLLAPLLAGTLLRLRSARPRSWPRHFGTAGGVLVVLMFLIIGLSLTPAIFVAGGTMALAVIAARLLAKLVGTALFGRLSGASVRQTLSLGLALNPVSGVSYVLALSFVDLDQDRLLHPAMAVAFTSIALLELAGPLLTRWALRYSGDIPRTAQGRDNGESA